MRKLSLLLLCLVSITAAFATNYYVDAINGSNGNPGTSPGQAFLIIQTAANLTAPGDTVFIMNGTYSAGGTVLNAVNSGSAGLPIVFTAYPGHSPKIQASVTSYNIVNIAAGVSYITINGLEVVGWGVNMSLAADTAAAQAQQTCVTSGSPSTGQAPVNKYNQNGINSDSRSLGTTGNHHLVISNNVVHDCGGAGIAVNQSDYVTIEGNTVYNNSWYTIYGTSGISTNNFVNYDNNSGYHTIIRNNVAYNNRMYVPWRAVCYVSDGNGIILDIPLASYTGRTLVYNNIVYNNGGSGIHTLNTNYTDIVHNTAYYNQQSPAISNGEIYARNTDGVKIINNILVAAPGETVSGSYTNTNLTQDYNIYSGGGPVDIVGIHSLLQDPKFVSPSTNPATANFRVQARSVAINNGDNANSIATDKDGTARLISTAVEIGAYEINAVGAFNSTGTQQSKILGTGNGTGEGSAGYFFGPYQSRPNTANNKSRHAIIYPQALLGSGTAVPANSIINNLQFRRAVQTSTTNVTPSTSFVPANSIVRIYLRNEASDNFGASAFDWTTILPDAANPAVLVYGGEASPLIGTGGGWKQVTFQVPFTYTGGNLGVYIEYLQKGSNSGSDINWIYDNAGTQPLYTGQDNGTKYTSTTGAISNSLTTANLRRPVMTVGYYVPTVILPVTLVQFVATKRSEGVYVNWLVASETNNAGFEVQRSADGVRFQSLHFEGSKAPGGNSATPVQYNFIDAQPLTGTSFYRLLQKDKDGRLAYSRIVSVRGADAAGFITL